MNENKATLWALGVGDDVEYNPGTTAARGIWTRHKITKATPTRLTANGYTFRRDTGFRYGAQWSYAWIRVPESSQKLPQATPESP